MPPSDFSASEDHSHPASATATLHKPNITTHPPVIMEEARRQGQEQSEVEAKKKEDRYFFCKAKISNYFSKAKFLF